MTYCAESDSCRPRRSIAAATVVTVILLASGTESHGQYNSRALGEAGGMYIGIHHVLAAMKNSPCGYALRKTYDVKVAISEVKSVLRDSDRRELDVMLSGSEWQREKKELEHTFIYGLLEAGKRDKLDTKTVCGMVVANVSQALKTASDRWKETKERALK